MTTSARDEPVLDVAIIGGGGAGLLAGIAAGRAGAQAVVFERNAQPGIKVAIAGGGRCNFSNTYEPRAFIREFGDPNAVKLGHALRAFPNQELIDLLASHGVHGVLEQGYRLYTASRRGRDVVEALRKELTSAGAQLLPHSTIESVRAIQSADGPKRNGSRFILSGQFAGRAGERQARTVIVCTGGLSYPKTGSTGDGFNWARAFGHQVTAMQPGLVGLVLEEDWPRSLQGLSCADACVRLYDVAARGRKPLSEERAGLLFTHFGLSGPAVIDLSLVFVRRHLGRARVELDFRPEQSAEVLDRQLSKVLQANPQRPVSSLLDDLPERLRTALMGLLGEEGRRKAGQFPREARRRLVELLKGAPLTALGVREIEHGEVTVGGVAWDDIDPATMQSRLVPGLFLAGEMLDIAGRCGGFNLQSAFSTGYLAGQSAARLR